MEVVRRARVLVIVDEGRHESRENLQIRQPVLRKRTNIVYTNKYHAVRIVFYIYIYILRTPLPDKDCLPGLPTQIVNYRDILRLYENL